MKLNRTFRQASRLLALLSVVLISLLNISCHSTPKSSAADSVEIRGNTPGQIFSVAIDVFKENGYKVMQTDPGSLVFEKLGTGMNNFVYGNWTADAPVWVRVKVYIVPIAEAAFRLKCSVHMLRDRGGATEEEVKVTSWESRSYQKLLQDVAARFTPRKG